MSRSHQIQGNALLSWHYEEFDEDEESPQDAITNILLALDAGSEHDADSILRMAIINFEAERQQ